MQKLNATTVNRRRLRINKQMTKLDEKYEKDKAKLDDRLKQLRKQCAHRSISTCYGPDGTIWTCNHCGGTSDDRFGRFKR